VTWGATDGHVTRVLARCHSLSHEVFRIDQAWQDERALPTDCAFLDVLAPVRGLEAIEDPEERARARAEFEWSGAFGAPRMFIGHTAAGEATMALRGGQGNVRLRLIVEEDDAAAIESLNPDGNVVRTVSRVLD